MSGSGDGLSREGEDFVEIGLMLAQRVVRNYENAHSKVVRNHAESKKIEGTECY